MTFEEQYQTAWRGQINGTSRPQGTPRLDALTARVEKLEARLDELSTLPPDPPDRPSPMRITAHMILDMVSFAFCVPQVDLTSRRKCKPAVLARQVAACLMRTLTSLTLPQIGRLLGGRDHSTIMHAISTITARCETDTLLRAKIKHMEDQLRKAPVT
jgi:chromosomal replication initiation ATPase DnaA